MELNSPLKIYNASAGSGKTYTLVKELLRYILSSSQPRRFQHVLAVTFTNKAAQEMKSRILKELSTLAQKPSESNYYQEFLKALEISEENLQQRAKKTLQEIIHHYSLFNVSTIDTFNLRLMRSFAKDMGLSYNFDVEMEAAPIIDEATHLLFSNLEVGDELSTIITEMALNNMQKDRSWDVSYELAKDAKKSFEDEFRAELEKFHQKGIQYLENFRQKKQKEQFEIQHEIKDLAQQAIYEINENGIPPEAFFQSNRGVYGFFKESTEGKIKKSNNYVLNFFEERKLTSSKTSDSDYQKIEEIFEGLKNIYEKIIEKIARHEILQLILKKLNALILLSELSSYIHHIQQEGNFLMISDFNKTISQHLQQQPAHFIYEKLGIRYDKFFIDEFQDTSRIQWNNLFPLLEDALAQNHEVALVGDPKQAIYRFRGGDVNLMLDLLRHKIYPAQLFHLDTNYRSAENVIEFTNHFFSWVAPQLPTPDFEKIYIEGNQQKVNHRKGGYVRIEICDSKAMGLKSKEAQLKQILLQIQRILANDYPLSSIAILCRTRGDAILVSEFLKAKEIPVISNESLLLRESAVIQLLQTFFRFYNEPQKPELRFEFLRQLKKLNFFSEEEFAPFVFENKEKNTIEFFKALEKIGLQLDLNFIQNLSLFDLTEYLIQKFQLENQERTYLIRYLDEILKFQQKQNGDLSDWLRHFQNLENKLSVNLPEGNDAVLVMTIHKSKGLEFPIVILPFCDWEMKSGGIWVDLENEDVERIYVEAAKDTTNLPPQMQATYEDEVNHTILDEVNVFYVATTRAEQQLYLFGPAVKESKKWLYNLLLNYVEQFGDGNIYEKGIFKALEKKEKKESAEGELKFMDLNYRADAWQNKILISTEHADLENERNVSRITGKQIHLILERIPHSAASMQVLEKLELEGVITAEQTKELQVYLDQVFHHPKLEKFFKPLENLNERDFVALDGEIFRPDRLVKIQENQWVLIDYKTGAKNARYREQLNFYAKALNELGFLVVQKFLVYLHERVEVEEIV